MKNIKRILLKILRVLIYLVLITFTIVLLGKSFGLYNVFFKNFKSQTKTDFVSYDEFINNNIHPLAGIIPKELPEGAKDISYYLKTSKFDSAAGVSFVLDKDEYNEFKKDFSCNIVLADTCKESKSEKNRNHMNYKMVSKYGKKCIDSLISDDLSEYEILNLTITKQDVPIYGIGIVGNNETGKIIIFYNYERYPDCDYYKDILNDDI